MRLTTLLELEKTIPLNLIGLIYDSPVWHYRIYNTYHKYLDFMSDTDTEYPSTFYSVGSVIIDYLVYYPVNSVAACKQADSTFFLDGADLYIHFKDHYPPYVLLSKKQGVIYGFTNKSVIRINGVTYLPEVTSSPKLEEGVDPVEYARMAFQTGTAELTNANRTFDTLFDVFGNDCNLRVLDEDTNEIRNLQKYYVEDYSTSMLYSSFSLKDKRDLLSRKIPTAPYSATTYPYISADMVGEPMQDAFGKLYGVPGVCLNETEGNVAKTFRFGSFITSLDSVKVFRNEQWETVAPSSTNYSSGTVTLSVANSHDGGDYTKGLLKVKATGIFRAETNPADIIMALVSENTDTPMIEQYWDLDEIAKEKTDLANIGVFIGEAAPIYDYIEDIQGGSDIGFQFFQRYGRFTIRCDNPNRNTTFSITPDIIMNIDSVRVDYNATKYATTATIKHSQDIDSEEYTTEKNTAYREAILELHRVDKDLEVETFLQTQTDAANKAEVLLDDLKQLRPIIRGVRVAGTEWFDVKLYDIGTVDVSRLGVVRQNITAPEVDRVGLDSGDPERYIDIDNATEDTVIYTGVLDRRIRNTVRAFYGTMRVQVIARRVDIENGTVEFDLRQRDFSNVYRSVAGG